ncbi:hypothetical protein [Hydrogenobacter thermophilus]|uniref:hypothetical protein n=1 Tax=Hydrogenobacter thermophilus TaxID=940 RepID=UPI0030FBBA56
MAREPVKGTFMDYLRLKTEKLGWTFERKEASGVYLTLSSGLKVWMRSLIDIAKIIEDIEDKLDEKYRG